MADQSVRLVYPPALVSSPVINQLIRRYDLTINIIRANITLEEGWIEIQLSGEEPVIDEAIKWLKNQGITIQRG